MPRGKRKHRQDIGARAIPQTVNKQDTLSGLVAWRTIRRLGAGSHGAVYEVESRAKPGKRAALKILNHLLQDERAKSRFKQEADAARLVRHPNVVEVFDADVTEDGKCYLLMELVLGRRLDQLDLPLPIHQALAIGADVAAALGAAHARGVVHRDVKPQNILLSRESTGTERVKLLDFGIAKLLDPEQSSLNTATGERLGTPAYMAPEQWRCVREIDGRADVYALGITLYELLMGLQPFQASSDYEWGQVHDKQELPQRDSFLNLPSEVQTLILKMVEKDREKRPQQMSQLAVELRKLSETLYVPPPRLARPRRYATTGLLLLSLISLTSDHRVEDEISPVWFPTPWGKHDRKGSLSNRQRGFRDGHPQGQEDDPVEETQPSNGVTMVPTHPGRPILDSLEYPRSSLAVENLLSGWPWVWPGFSNGRESTPQKAGRGGGVQSHAGFQVRLVWRTPPPTQTTTIRISSGSRSIYPDNAVLTGTADEGWFQHGSDTLTLDPTVQQETHGPLLFEARDQYGCLLAVGNMTSEDVMSESTHYVSLDTPNREEFLELKVEQQPRSGDGTMQPGVLLVRDSQQTPLIDCGSRCRCWIPRRTSLHFVGLGGERTPFAEWSIPSCKQSSRCVLSESELRAAQPDVIVGTFLSWQQVEDGWETLLPHPIALRPELQSYYHTRLAVDYANPTQLRAVASNRSGSFWLAGRGGVLMKWDGLLRTLVTNQVGEVDPAAPKSPCDEFRCVVGRTTDFYSVSQQRDGIAYAVGHKEFRGPEARATAFRFDGENWTPTTIVSGSATSSGLPQLDTMKTLLSVWSSPTGNKTLTVGYLGGVIDSAGGVLSNPDPFTRNLWSVTGNEAGWVLMAGGSNQPKRGPIVMMMAPGGKPVVQDSLRLLDGSPIPNVTLRSSWLSADGRQVWLGGLAGPLYQYERDEHGQLVPTTVCEKGALSIRILSMWGTAKNNVWAASRNHVLHCDGTNPWTIRHTAPPGVELTGIAGDPTGEIWVVGFYKAPDQNPGPTGPNDFAYVARLRPESRPRVGESLFPQDEVVSEQSADHPERSVN